MDMIRISDCTLKQSGDRLPLSFREKIELCKLIDRLNVSAIELPAIEKVKADSLLIKSVCAAVQQAQIAVPVKLNEESVSITWNALKNGRHPRLQVAVPVSSVQMEYLLHLKPNQVKSAVERILQCCQRYTDEVEFIAEDASRGDTSFLHDLLRTVIQTGVKQITLCDTASNLLPEETALFIQKLRNALPELENICIGFACHNDLSLSDACAVAALQNGVRDVKVAAYRMDHVSLKHLARILDAKGSEMGLNSGVNMSQMGRITGQIAAMCSAVGGRMNPFEKERQSQEEIAFSAHDTLDAVKEATQRLGYDLTEDDLQRVWTSFQSIAETRGTLTLHELDAIVATEALQVPPAYTDVNYVVNTGNTVGSMAHLRLKFRQQELEGTATGNGVIDAAFMAVEQATGRHFELEDFQVQTVAEGQTSMGETLVKLRNDGKLYSGRGISTDIVGASVMAYVNALNKIVYEEGEG